jgi:type VI protein secretion system component VasK
VGSPLSSPLQDPDQAEACKARLEHLCELIARDRRPYCGVNGILLLINLTATDNDGDAAQVGEACREDLATVRKGLGVRCPVLAVLCDCETLPGFREFARRFPPDQSGPALGQHFPLAQHAEPGDLSALVEGRVRWVLDGLLPGHVYRMFSLDEKCATEPEANVSLFRLMCESRQRAGRLGRLLARAVAVAAHGDEPTLLGCHLATTGRDPEDEQAFVGTVLGRLLATQNCVSWTQQCLKEDKAYQRLASWGYTCLISLAAVTALSLLLR